MTTTRTLRIVRVAKAEVRYEVAREARQKTEADYAAADREYRAAWEALTTEERALYDGESAR